MNEVIGEIRTDWARVRNRLLKGRFPTFAQFEAQKPSFGDRVFVHTSADEAFDFDFLEEFCTEGLPSAPTMYARLRYQRFDFRTDAELLGLSFEFNSKLWLTHFAIAHWAGDPHHPKQRVQRTTAPRLALCMSQGQ